MFRRFRSDEGVGVRAEVPEDEARYRVQDESRCPSGESYLSLFVSTSLWEDGESIRRSIVSSKLTRLLSSPLPPSLALLVAVQLLRPRQDHPLLGRTRRHLHQRSKRHGLLVPRLPFLGGGSRVPRRKDDRTRRQEDPVPQHPAQVDPLGTFGGTNVVVQIQVVVVEGGGKREGGGEAAEVERGAGRSLRSLFFLCTFFFLAVSPVHSIPD